MSCLSYCCGGSGDDHGPAGLPIFLQRLMYAHGLLSARGIQNPGNKPRHEAEGGCPQAAFRAPQAQAALWLLKGKKAHVAHISFANTSTWNHQRVNREKAL